MFCLTADFTDKFERNWRLILLENIEHDAAQSAINEFQMISSGYLGIYL